MNLKNCDWLNTTVRPAHWLRRGKFSKTSQLRPVTFVCSRVWINQRFNFGDGSIFRNFRGLCPTLRSTCTALRGHRNVFCCTCKALCDDKTYFAVQCTAPSGGPLMYKVTRPGLEPSPRSENIAEHFSNVLREFRGTVFPDPRRKKPRRSP